MTPRLKLTYNKTNKQNVRRLLKTLYKRKEEKVDKLKSRKGAREGPVQLAFV